MLQALADDIDEVRLDGKDVPVKLKVFDSLFVPFAKWSMLLTGNYRCITGDTPAVDPRRGAWRSRHLEKDLRPDRRARSAARRGSLPIRCRSRNMPRRRKACFKPSSAARAVANGAPMIERVDMLVQLIGQGLDMQDPAIDTTVDTVDAALARNQRRQS